MSRRRAAMLVLLAVGLPVLVAGGWLAGTGWQARGHLLASAELAQRLQHELANGDRAAAQETLSAMQRETRAAQDQTGTLPWRIGRRVPWLGANLAATDAVAAAADNLAHQVLPPLVEVAAELDPAALAPRGGSVDLAPLQRAAPRAAKADRAVRAIQGRVSAIDTGSLLPPVRSAVDRLRQQVDRSAASIDTLARATALAPPMLGADGPRTYLVLFQNPAELRATGGMPGAYAVLRADRGQLRIIEQGTAASDLGKFEEPVLPLDPAMRALYTDKPAIYPANINLTPHFPTSAELAREMYERRSERRVDGVLATDPVALSYLLRATGPVELPGGDTLTADNAVRVLLSDVYARIDSPAAQDEYFADAAVAGFDALVDGGADPRSTIRELARAAGERRILLWSADPSEQELIAGTALAGELPTDDGLRPTVGVFLNDGSGAKLGYYLSPAAAVSLQGCRPDGRRELRLRVTLESTAPEHGLSKSVLGLGLAGDPYTARTSVSIFSPAGGAVVEVRRDGEPVPVGAGMERQRGVAVLAVEVAPGTAETIEATLLTDELPADQALATDLRLTPTATSWSENSEIARVCPVDE